MVPDSLACPDSYCSETICRSQRQVFFSSFSFDNFVRNLDALLTGAGLQPPLPSPSFSRSVLFFTPHPKVCCLFVLSQCPSLCLFLGVLGCWVCSNAPTLGCFCEKLAKVYPPGCTPSLCPRLHSFCSTYFIPLRLTLQRYPEGPPLRGGPSHRLTVRTDRTLSTSRVRFK